MKLMKFKKENGRMAYVRTKRISEIVEVDTNLARIVCCNGNEYITPMNIEKLITEIKKNDKSTM
jgi:hypothetical protein